MLSKEEITLENRKIEAINGVEQAVRLLSLVVSDIKRILSQAPGQPIRKKAVKKGK